MFQKPNKGGFKKKFKAKEVVKVVAGFEKEEVQKKSTVLIQGFNGNQVESLEPPEPERGPLVIPFVGNSKGWRAKTKTYVPDELKNRDKEVITQANLNSEEGERKFGLNIIAKKESKVKQTELLEIETDKNNEPATLDEQARIALLNEVNGKKEATIEVIPLIQSKTEDEVLKEDIENAPPENTLDDYEQVPIEEFGAALLRGMGWKDGQAIGRKRGEEKQTAYVPTRRPRLLGLGAKEREVPDAKKKKK